MRDATSVAVLLPASGRFAGPSQAIRDGISTASLDSPFPRPTLQYFDSGETRSAVLSAFDAAMATHPDIVIGPLLKPQVEALADMRRLTRPVLALNYLDNTIPAPQRLFQFGLSPQDEARQAADSAIDSGLDTAVVLQEQGEWGARTAAAFRDRYAALGGVVLADRRFDGDHPATSTDAIRELLDPGGVRVGEGQRIDMVFVAAGARQTHQIVPMLRFFWHRDRPLVVYGTAAAYDRPLHVEDREGFRFCGMPALVSPPADVASEAVGSSGKRPVNAERMFGLGYDAYRTARAIARRSLPVGQAVDGRTGILVMQDDRSIVRHLSCAEVSGGRLQALRDEAETVSD